jgi:amidase/aspartyl-tRNA(Asn)/glutamyl-tRNA(Gln) amidotransferase subunit A
MSAPVEGQPRAADTALARVQASLSRIAATDAQVNAFTDVLAERALTRAEALDRSGHVGPLAGVPFAVKNLYDVRGLPTRAGSRIGREAAPATRDAALVRRLEAAGAVLVGALNMDEYAYGFTTENTHDGPTRNPHALERLAGGSSGGSAAAVAAGQVALSLGSDTNGSIRVPAALCGVRAPAAHGELSFRREPGCAGPLCAIGAGAGACLRRAPGP